ncbi:hypothetical protein [Paenibacillus polymyxa]|uniref:hypothetical protein n=1 Tax=Paenibacillus polymyxa TaxID=1406 RepID=UPI002AB3851A|nr:hypothetical protein [Paenibacillus polymyxa]MDY8021168.1 hypothetical protein [Paenibacillus polymyxa]
MTSVNVNLEKFINKLKFSSLFIRDPESSYGKFSMSQLNSFIYSLEIILATESEFEQTHENIPSLFREVDIMYRNRLYSNVIHVSGKIIEVLIKDILALPKYKNKTFSQMKDDYKKVTKLNDEHLIIVENIIRMRNTLPNAAHGSTEKSNVTEVQAKEVIQQIKNIVRIEYEI